MDGERRNVVPLHVVEEELGNQYERESRKQRNLARQLNQLEQQVNEMHQKYEELLQVYEEQSRKTLDLLQQLEQGHEQPFSGWTPTLNNAANGYPPPSDPSSSERVSIADNKVNANQGTTSIEDNKVYANQGTTRYQNQKEEVEDSYYEYKLRSDIVPPNEIDVTFDDIGALEETKKLIHGLVILPIRRPELFKGGLLKPCKGILLFGPPGTGKTMLAKAVARECGANFINVSLSSIFSMWIGESEHNVKALFTLAAKIAPTVIFVDEIGSLLGRRTSDEYDSAYRKVKNEFMLLWDGLRTKVGKQILVLGATNRPFDLDEAIIRRFERRIMVGLPCEISRECILKKILEKDVTVESINFKELAVLTEGYTGSDLKNLCTTAAYQPLWEFLEQEKDVAPMDDNHNRREEPFLRPLNMDDIKLASKQIAPSFSADGPIMLELKKWNDVYGEGGSRR